MNHALVTDLFPGAQTREWANSIIPGWQITNPSIAFHPEGGHRAALRLVNYAMDEATLQYPTAGADDVIRTKTLLAVCDPDWNILDAQVIDDSGVRQDAYPLVRGMEDVRLYYRDGWRAYGTLREHRPDGLPQMAVDRLEGHKVVARRVLYGPTEGRAEKNWMVLDSGPNYVYEANPPVIVGGLGGQRKIECRTVGELDADLRGGSQVVRHEDGYLAVTHEVEWTTGPAQRLYRHRILRFSAGMDLVAWTPPFFFRSPGVEFAAGLVVQGDRLTISLGYKDRGAMLCSVPVASLGLGR